MRLSGGAELSRSQTQFYNRYCSAVSFRRLLGCWGTTLSSDSKLTEMVIEMLKLQYPPAATRNTAEDATRRPSGIRTPRAKARYQIF